MSPIKRVLSALIAATGMALIPLTSNSQEYPGCFMRNESGRLIDLNHICVNSSPAGSDVVSGMFRVPIKRRQGGTPVVEVTFNGQQRFDMLFDTGATGTVITESMAKALKVKVEGSVMAQTAGGVVPNPIGRVASAQAGGVVVKDLTVAVNSHLDIGLLGQNFFGKHDITIKEDVIEFKIRR